MALIHIVDLKNEGVVMLMQILGGAPWWVWIVFCVLLAYGYMLSKTRDLNKIRVAILPAIMIVLSIGGVLLSFGAQLASLLPWAAGFAVAVVANRVIRASSGVTFNPATGKFRLPGSWIPLTLMMAIFFARYTVGATTAMRPDVVATNEFIVILSAVFGLLSGTFFARFLQIWSAAQTVVRAFAADPTATSNQKTMA